jgi:hypothetical protein
MIHLRYFDKFINESVRPEEVDSYFKKYNDFKAKGIKLVNPSIEWKGPDDDYIKKEINEIPENLATVWLGKNANVKNLFPKMIEKLITILGPETDAAKRLRNGEVIMNGEIITGDIKKQIADDKEVQEEAINVIKEKGKLVDWSDMNISQTGNMGTLKDLTKYNVNQKVKSTGEKGIEEFIQFAKTLTGYKKADLVNYLPTYTDLLQNGKSKQYAPFLVNIPHSKKYHCIGGHKRSTIANQLEIPLKVWLIEF